MSKLHTFIVRVDRRVDRVITPLWERYKKFVPYLAIALMFGMVASSLYRIVTRRPEKVAYAVVSDVQTIVTILEKVDESCDILGFDHERTYVDFLNVVSFTGSEVGGVNLARPEKWEGPYIQDVPTLQGKTYEIVRVKQGYFLVPGTGVRLPSGLILGKDIIITPDSDLEAMLSPGGVLHHRGLQLGRMLPFKVGDWKSESPSPEVVEDVNEALEEFNEAMPYAQYRLERSDARASISYFRVL